MNTKVIIPAETLLPYLSASALQDYITCPKRFWFRRITKRKPEHRGAALVFGSAWGNTVAHYIGAAARGDTPSIDKLAQYFTEQFDHEEETSDVPVVFAEKDSSDSLKETARRMLVVFTEQLPVPDEVLGIEKAFSVVLTHPDDDHETLPIPFVGALDALVRIDGETVVWEFKSAAKRYADSQFEWMLQPGLYSLGMQAFGLQEAPVDVVVTTKTKQPDLQVRRLLPTRAAHLELYDLADAVLRGVEAGVFPRSRSPMNCTQCSYRRACDR